MDTDRSAGDGGSTLPHDLLQTLIDFLPSGVTLFDSELRMVACNRQFRELLEFPDELFADGLPCMRRLAEFNVARGEYGPGDPAGQVEGVLERARRMQAHVFERTRPDGRVLEVRGNPLPGGGFVTIYTDITERKRAEEEARRAASYLDAVVSALPQGITVIDEALDIALWNPAFVKVQNLPDDFMRPGVSFADVIRFNARRGEYGEVDVEDKVRRMVELARRFEPHRLERTRGDGGVMEVEGRVVSEGGRPIGFVTTYTDITERVNNERTIRRVRDLMGEAVNFSPTCIWETGPDGSYTFVQGMEKILGVPDSHMLGKDRWQRLCGDECAEGCAGAAASGERGDCRVRRAIAAREPIERWTLATRNRRGEAVWLSCTARPVHDEHGELLGYRGVDVDVSELTRAHRDLEQIALHDPLTGLANRRKFHSRYELEAAHLQRTGSSFALLLIDIDFFKQVNDLWGHLVGDDCLRGVANVLSGNVRAVDMVGRFGGEEFLVLLSDTGVEGARTVAEKLRQAVASSVPASPGGAALRLTVSIGVACAPGERRRAPDFDHLLAEADRAVYAAKHAGRNRVCTALPGATRKP